MNTTSPDGAAHAAPRPVRPAVRTRSRTRLVLVVALGLVLALIAALLIDVALINRRIPRTPLTATSSAAGQTWLIVGVDDRSDAPDWQGDDFGKAAPGGRADIAILARQVGDDWQLISIPRDTQLEGAAGLSSLERFAITYNRSRQEAINRLCTGLQMPVSHLVQFNFRSFATIVDRLGGLELTLPHALRDQQAHLALPSGRQRLDGRQALALVRSRHQQSLENGAWVDHESDGQQTRQRSAGFVLALVAAQLHRANPLQLQNAAWDAAPDLLVDKHTSLLDLASLRTLKGQPEQLPGTYNPDLWSFLPTPKTLERLRTLGYDQGCQLG